MVCQLGPQSSLTRAWCAGLAVVKYKLGHWKEVQDLFARAYDIQSTHLEPDHADLAATMSHSAGLLKAMSKLGDAEIVYRTVSLSPADTRVESWPQAVGR